MTLPVLVIAIDPAQPRVLQCALWRDACERASVAVSPEPRLPCAGASLGTVVVAGVLEWLGAPEAYGLLLDCHRVLAADGRLVLDVPDGDAALAAWRRGEAGAAATAAVFCTYRDAQHAGPPRLAPGALDELLARSTPFRLAVDLRHAVLDAAPRFQLARRSAWGRDELVRDVRRAGFVVHSLEPGDAARALAGVPGAPVVEGRLCCVAAPAFPASRPGLTAREELRECQQALALQAGHAVRHYRLLWARFGRAVEEAAGEAAAADPGFRARGYAIAHLPWHVLAAFHASLAGARPIPLAADDYAPGYIHNDALSSEVAAVINQCSIFLAIGPAQRALVPAVLRALAPTVRACLGTGFRALNVRCWRTPTRGLIEETQTWHKDELYPREAIKAMIYLSPVGGAFGSTELALDDGARVIVEGPPGTVLVFRNAVLTHRGVPPRGDQRIVLELTLAPWPEDDLRPRCAGLNAELPAVPWDPLDGL